MKHIFQSSGKLLGFSLVLLFSACSENEDVDPIMQVYEHLEIQFEANTLTPIVNETKVILNGEIVKTLPDHSIRYGFYWSLDKKCPEPEETGFLEVNEGVFTGVYKLETTDLPENQDLVVRACLISSIDDRIRIAGDEVKLRL